MRHFYQLECPVHDREGSLAAHDTGSLAFGLTQVDKVAHGLLPLLLGTSRSRREITLLLELASAHAEAEQFEQADYFADRCCVS